MLVATVLVALSAWGAYAAYMRYTEREEPVAVVVTAKFTSSRLVLGELRGDTVRVSQVCVRYLIEGVENERCADGQPVPDVRCRDVAGRQCTGEEALAHALRSSGWRCYDQARIGGVLPETCRAMPLYQEDK